MKGNIKEKYRIKKLVFLDFSFKPLAQCTSAVRGLLVLKLNIFRPKLQPIETVQDLNFNLDIQTKLHIPDMIDHIFRK